MKAQPIKKVIWSIDAMNPDEDKTQAHAAQTLRWIAFNSPLEIEPVFVLSPKNVSASPNYYPPHWKAVHGAYAEKKLDSISKHWELPGLQTPQIIFEKSASTRGEAHALVEYAKDQKVDLIVVSTHARKGLSRFFLGSFAETILLQSKVPVLTVNPNSRCDSKIREILFPSDFAQASRRGFEATVGMARQLGAKLFLYYKEPLLPSMPLVEAPLVYDFLLEESLTRQKTVEAWMNWAKAQGIHAECFFDEKPGDITSAIVDFAQKKKVDLIAMVAQSGPIASAILGGITRQIVRHADCPVWVQHTKS